MDVWFVVFIFFFLIIMDFSISIQKLSERIKGLSKETILTEEATKNAMIMPFLSALWYDVFNPLEVVPEYTADVGLKKWEKVDYCLMKDGKPIVIVECKHHVENLQNHDSQLYRYFWVTNAKFWLLTNGVYYKFFTDLDETNKMDKKPFLEFDLTNLDDATIQELKKFHKESFDQDLIFSTASDLKYAKEIKNIFTKEYNDPSESFIKFFLDQVYEWKKTGKVLEQFSWIIKKSFTTFVNDLINTKLSMVMNNSNNTNQETTHKDNEENKLQTEEKVKIIETTDDEKWAYWIVKSMLRWKCDPARIFLRDSQTYCSVILDDNNRKPIIKLHFNGIKKYVSFFLEDWKEDKILIEKIDDLWNHEDKIINLVKKYDK